MQGNAGPTEGGVSLYTRLNHLTFAVICYVFEASGTPCEHHSTLLHELPLTHQLQLAPSASFRNRRCVTRQPAVSTQLFLRSQRATPQLFLGSPLAIFKQMGTLPHAQKPMRRACVEEPTAIACGKKESQWYSVAGYLYSCFGISR